MKVLVLGITGMLGNTLFNKLMEDMRYDVWGTIRQKDVLTTFPKKWAEKILTQIDVLSQDSLISVLERVTPEIVINCTGLIKQHATSEDPLHTLPINSILPHRLSRLCKILGARLIHFSTDCVFSGSKGLYVESDPSDAMDLYGKSKFIGELHQDPHAVTLRTSIIGHELSSKLALIDWFLSQSVSIKGYKKVIFSGFPTAELSRIILDFVIPLPELSGLYHVSADPIDKCSLLKMVAEIYDKKIDVIPDKQLCIDRTLDSTRFRNITGYQPPPWQDLIKTMHSER